MELLARAKLNLPLDVLGRRGDGYHDLRMVMQTITLADTLTLTVEKNTIGQGMILDPVQVEFAKGETCADVLLRGLSENGITPLYDTNTSYGFYLRGIANCDSGSLNPPACIQKVLSETSTWTGDAYKLTDNKYAPDLTEFSYCSASGWTYTLDNVFMGVGMGASHPSDGSVLRVMSVSYTHLRAHET